VTRTHIALACLLAAVALAVLGCGSGEIDDSELEQRLTDIRQATNKYKDPRVAQRDGYAPSPKCTESPGDGAAGIVFANRALSRDQKIDPVRPEQLLYEPGEGGARTLVGVAYFVPDIDQRPPDSPFGHLNGPIPETVKGQGDYFALNAWVHKKNPNGVFDTWNPDVKC
jgi:hypothetical protein